MVSKGRHSKNEINAAFKTLSSEGFDVIFNKNGHRWGRVVCLACGERFTVHSTPRNPGSHAQQITRFAQAHAHHQETP